MLFSPRKSKFKKYQKGSLPNKIKNNILFKTKSAPSIKLVSANFGPIKIKQLLSIRLLIRKSIRKLGFLSFNVFPQKIISKKPAQIRMGKGKGSFSHWVVNVFTGFTICEVFCRNSAKKSLYLSLKKAQKRLPIKTIIKYA
jgi:large subunit ribosomal protein L16